MYREPPHENRIYRTICTKRTVASMIAHLRRWLPRQLQMIWACMSSPCTSIYIPVYASTTRIPSTYTHGVGGRDFKNYDSESAWWVFKKLQVLVDENYSYRQPIVRREWDKLFNQILMEIDEIESKVLRLIRNNKHDEAQAIIDKFVEEKLMKAYQKAQELIELLSKETIQPEKPVQQLPHLAMLLAKFTASSFLLIILLRLRKNLANEI